jgi:hypothetical protein
MVYQDSLFDLQEWERTHNHSRLISATPAPTQAGYLGFVFRKGSI